ESDAGQQGEDLEEAEQPPSRSLGVRRVVAAVLVLHRVVDREPGDRSASLEMVARPLQGGLGLGGRQSPRGAGRRVLAGEGGAGLCRGLLGTRLGRWVLRRLLAQYL